MSKLNDLKKCKDNFEKNIAPIYLTNRLSATLIIPIGMARRNGLDHPTHVMVEEKAEGILIRKIQD